MSFISRELLSVFVIEPSQMQWKVIKQHLLDIGIGEKKISRFDLGAKALENIVKSQPDLVVSAMYLPDMTGTDLIKTMRKTDSTSEIPFMLISSETSFKALDPIRQAGVIAILPKPFDKTQLDRALTNTIELLDPSTIESSSFEPEALDVLIVDDSRTARKHIQKVLAGMGIEKFTLAENGVEALKIIQEKYFDLIVTDYNMPEMDGQELIRQVRTSSNQSSVPIIMVTSEQSENRIAAVQQSGVSAICDKPFGPLTVKAIVESVFE